MQNIFIQSDRVVTEIQNVAEDRQTNPRPWRVTLVSLLPLWLLSIAVMAEGFPSPPISIGLAKILLVFAIAISIVLLWKNWMTVELLLYSGFFPFLFLYAFDEISTTYKTPFIIACALILTAGAIGYHRSRWHRLVRALLLLLTATAAYVIAWNATLNYWQMAADLDYVRCFPDAHGCVPLTGQETPWWVLFLTF
jgi:hypothetical protein